MRVLFATYPQKTHFMAMAPLAWAMRTAGHDVVFASQPKFCDTITQAGLTAVPVGTNRDLQQILARDANWFRIGLNGMPVPYDTADWPADQVTFDYLQDGYDLHVPKWHRMSNVPLISDLVEFAQQWKPDLVIWEPSTYAGAIAAKACGAAHGRVLFSLDGFGVARERFVELKGDRRDPLAEWLDTYCAHYGFEFSEELITGQFTVTVVPPSLSTEANLHYLPMRHVPYAGAAVLPAWLRTEPERPRVAITMGISTADLTGEVVDLPDVLAELADTDLEIVATLSEAAQENIKNVPDNVRLVSYVPLHTLAPTCTAVMHHGGIGTLLTIAAHGKPQLILPWNNDGPALARRVAAHGAGLALHVFQGSGRPVADRLSRLLTEPKFAAAAGALAAEIRGMPAPNDVVGDLEKLV